MKPRGPVCFALLILLFAPISFADSPESPFGVCWKSVSKYRADLFWFYSSVNDTLIQFDDGGWEAWMAVMEADRDNRLAVRFDLPDLPVCITGMSILVLEQDPQPSLPGDPFSPLEISLHEDDDGLPGNQVSDGVTVQASGEWIDGGEWVSAPFQHVVTSGSGIWVQVRWPSANPFMPKIGADAYNAEQVSYIGYRNGSSDVWLRSFDFSPMIRLELLRNTKSDPCPGSGCLVDSFHIYSRDRMPVSPDPVHFDSSTVGCQLHQRVHVDWIDNYFSVTAFSGGLESEASSPLHIRGAGGPTAPVTIRPRTTYLSVPPGRDTIVHVSVRNDGLSAIHYECVGTTPSRKDAVGLPIIIANGSGELDPGETDSISMQILSSMLPVGTYVETIEIQFIDLLEVYLPEDVAVCAIIDEQSSAGDDYLVPELPGTSIMCYPNPFNAGTSITVRLPDRAPRAEFTVVDVLGRRVTVLHPLESADGVLTYYWSGRDSDGQRCPSGIYFGRMLIGKSQTVKMLLLR